MAALFDPATLVDEALAQARKAGADAAEVLCVERQAVEVSQRLGKLEQAERSEARDLGVRVLIGQRQASVSSSDVSPAALAALVTRAVAMARATPADPYIGLADPSLLARSFPDFDQIDPIEPSAETLRERAAQAEAAALAVEGVTNSEGAQASWSRARAWLAASNGFHGGFEATSHGIGVSVLAGEGLAMEGGSDGWSTVHAKDLPDPAQLGRTAGQRAVRRLRPRRIATGTMPIIFEDRVAASLLGHLASAITGPAIAAGTSFLKNFLEKPVFNPQIAIIDDPWQQRRRASRAFDSEGLATQRRSIIEGGVLTGWLLDLRSARQLGLPPTGHAYRGTNGPPSPGVSNFYMVPGVVTLSELMADIKSGLYVTDLMGMGVNGVTGDYSRGAVGFFIENGELAFPVSEVTIAGNLKEMFRNLTPASDLVLRRSIDAPSVRIEGMTLAGC